MISLEKLKEEVKKAYISSCIKLPNSVKELFKQARNKEVEGSLAQKVFDILFQNAEIAERESLPLCQDTGIPVILVRISEGLTIPTGLESAINAGIAEAVKEGYLRASVAHPLTRENTGTNTPAVTHYEIVPGDELFEIWVMPKGCGSENMSRLAMLKPADGIEGIKDFVLETVKLAGPNPCPPLIVGVGIGGSFEHCAFLAKKALFRELGTPNPDPKVKALEEELLSEINKLGIGPLGFGGKTTALAVHVEVAHTHIASLPVAVNFLCHSARIAKIKFL
ncbi:MAG: fumarate hydratase [Thermodesulfobacterium sp.]|jgi:fumarate hydratase subunit alpha|nr:fumarate hydratase [Thermodesulfobacterium sp.]